MLKSLSSLSTAIFTKVSLAQENSALRAKVADLENALSVYQTERECYYGRATEIVAHLREVLEEHPELVDLSRRPNLVEVWSADFWRGKQNVSLKKLAMCYLRSMQLHSLIADAGNSDGLSQSNDYLSPCSRQTGRRVG